MASPSRFLYCRSTQVLTWALIPILQNYVRAGGFSVLKRLGEALHQLWLFWAICLVLCGAGEFCVQDWHVASAWLYLL